MTTEKSTIQTGVDLDKILVDEVGQFGKYQLITLLLAAFPLMCAGLSNTEYIFTTSRINHRCKIPECDDPIPEFVPSWILNAIPGTSITSFESCERFSRIKNSSIVPTLDNCPADAFDRTQTQKCDEIVYENQHSVVYDFNLGCDEWRRSLIGSFRTTGTLLVLPITGYISDRYGRRVALAINAFNTAWLGLVKSFMNSYEWYLVVELAEATLGAGAFSAAYILITELVGPKYRAITGITASCISASGQVTLGFIAWGVPYWRTLLRILYAPQLLTIFYFWILSESVRWLMSKGRYEESEEVLKKVARTNKKELSQKSLEALRATAEAEKNIPKPKEPWLVVLVFRSRVLLFRCIVIPLWWITNTLIYYGMSINSVNMIGNRNLNFIAVAAIDIPAHITGVFMLDRVGRKPVLICVYWLCAVCQFTFAFIQIDNSGLLLALYLFGKFCIAILNSSVYVFTTELYPTKYRHNLFAFSSMVGRLGSITAPLTPALAQEVWEPLPPVMFGTFAMLSGALIFTMPETIGSKLPETIEDAEQIGKKKNSL